MDCRVWEVGLLLLLFFGALTSVQSDMGAVCPAVPLVDAVMGYGDFFADKICVSDGDFDGHFFGVTEGDDISFQKVLNLVQEKNHEYVAVLFYASWCHFSRTCRPTFTILSSLYPSVRHFAVEESAIRPSILSKYGVHGFPTIFLLNSTMRARYHGSRTLSSLVAFYGNVTGIKPLSLDQESLEKLKKPSNLAKVKDTEEETCPFSWARSPENLLQQETYLLLASTFVLLRLLYFLLPKLVDQARCAWRRRHLRNASSMCLQWHPLSCLDQAMEAFRTVKEHCKWRNLHEGAKNARAWVSKSLASVSFGSVTERQ